MKEQINNIEQLKSQVDKALKQNYTYFKTLAEFVWSTFNNGCGEPPEDPSIDFHLFLHESTESAVERLEVQIEKAFKEFREEGVTL